MEIAGVAAMADHPRRALARHGIPTRLSPDELRVHPKWQAVLADEQLRRENEAIQRDEKLEALAP